jgi:hypothetical protein
MLDSRPYSAQSDAVRCEAPLTVLSLALPDPSRVTDFSVSAAPTLEGSICTRLLDRPAVHHSIFSKRRFAKEIAVQIEPKFQQQGWIQ